MEQAANNKSVSFIWGIADDVLRDLFVRGEYRDFILPMCVLRRPDAVLEPTKRLEASAFRLPEPASMSDEILTVQEVATLRKAADKTVCTMAQKGEIPAFKVRGQWRFRRADIDMWIQEQTAARRDDGGADD